MTLHMISTTVSDIGLVRKDNQDSTFAGIRLAAVCDGMGGHAGGDTASTIAIRSLAHLENAPLTHNKTKAVESIASMLSTSVIAAHDAIVGKAHREKQLAGMGTTVTAVTLVDGYWVVCHIGDSRAYMLREGEIIRVTKDHSYVQHLIDTGRITEEEAKSHPQRNVVMRVLGDFDIDPRPDISIRKAQPGDRWMLCSDGLSGSISDDSIRDILMTHSHLQECAQTLVSMAEKGGSTDNVSVVLIDAYAENDENIPTSLANASEKMCLIAGAASNQPQPIADTLNTLVAVAPYFHLATISNSPALKAAQLAASAKHAQLLNKENPSDSHGDQSENSDSYMSNDGSEDAQSQQQTYCEEELNNLFTVQRIVRPGHDDVDDDDDTVMVDATGEIPVVRKDDGSLVDDPHDPDVVRALRNKKLQVQSKQAPSSRIRRITVRIVSVLVILILLATGSRFFYDWSQSHYFIRDDNGTVAIYQGLDTNIFGYSLNHVLEDSDTELDDLPQGWQESIEKGIE